jgi:hypothetical protein
MSWISGYAYGNLEQESAQRAMADIHLGSKSANLLINEREMSGNGCCKDCGILENDDKNPNLALLSSVW